MKKLLTLLSLASTVAACQHSAPSTQASTVPLAVTVPVNAAAAMVVLPDSLTAEQRTILRRVDLDKLFLAAGHRELPTAAAVLDGFVGTDPQRLSLAILTIARDSLRPAMLHVTGKIRYQKHITTFSGDIQVVKLVDSSHQDFLTFQGDEFEQDTTGGTPRVTDAWAYCATAAFHFVGSQPSSMRLTGQALLDFWVQENGTTGLLLDPYGNVLEDTPAKGSGLLLKGAWQNGLSATTRSFVASPNVFALAPALVSDFGVGDRGTQINPKYAKLGWNEAWANDEWWADSPKPSLHL